MPLVARKTAAQARCCEPLAADQCSKNPCTTGCWSDSKPSVSNLTAVVSSVPHCHGQCSGGPGVVAVLPRPNPCFPGAKTEAGCKPVEYLCTHDDGAPDTKYLGLQVDGCCGNVLQHVLLSLQAYRLQQCTCLGAHVLRMQYPSSTLFAPCLIAQWLCAGILCVLMHCYSGTKQHGGSTAVRRGMCMRLPGGLEGAHGRQAPAGCPWLVGREAVMDWVCNENQKVTAMLPRGVPGRTQWPVRHASEAEPLPTRLAVQAGPLRWRPERHVRARPHACTQV